MMSMFRSVATVVAAVLLSQAMSIASEAAEEDWPGEQPRHIKDAVAVSATDPVLAVLIFEESLGRPLTAHPEGWTMTSSPAELTDVQKEWLKRKTLALKPEAIKKLQQDFDAAHAANDYRDTFVIASVAERIGFYGLDAKGQLTVAKERALKGATDDTYTWRVNQVEGKRLGKTYRESDGFSTGVLRAEKGEELVRVQVQVQNVSATSDKSYAVWGLPDSARFNMRKDGTEAGPGTPFRWMYDSLVFVVTPRGGLITPSLACAASDLRSSGEPFDGQWHPARAIPQGKLCSLDFIFKLPKGIENLQLLVLGAPAVTVREAK